MIKAAYPLQHFAAVDGSTLNEAGLAELRARIEARPHAYVAQEQVKVVERWFGSAASGSGKSSPGRSACASMRWRRPLVSPVMPGGLTRVAAKAGAATVLMQSGGGSKDTWVLADAPTLVGPRLMPRVLGVRDGAVRKDPYLPSRLVENLYWLAVIRNAATI